jgi:hypothetical protein
MLSYPLLRLSTRGIHSWSSPVQFWYTLYNIWIRTSFICCSSNVFLEVCLLVEASLGNGCSTVAYFTVVVQRRVYVPYYTNAIVQQEFVAQDFAEPPTDALLDVQLYHGNILFSICYNFAVIPLRGRGHLTVYRWPYAMSVLCKYFGPGTIVTVYLFIFFFY